MRPSTRSRRPSYVRQDQRQRIPYRFAPRARERIDGRAGRSGRVKRSGMPDKYESEPLLPSNDGVIVQCFATIFFEPTLARWAA